MCNSSPTDNKLFAFNIWDINSAKAVIDASSDMHQNANAVTKSVHASGVIVEAEVGQMKGVEDAIQRLIDEDNFDIKVVPTEGTFWAEVDFPEDYKRACGGITNTELWDI